MTYTVIQFYPGLGVPVRAVEYKKYSEAIETVNICRNYAEVPYLLLRDGKIIDFAEFDLGRKAMAEMIEKYL